MRYLIILFILTISGCSSVDVAFLLNEQTLIAETTPKKPPLNVKVFKVTEHGECFENQCPLSQLYIAVSEYGEYPNQAYYISPKRNNWLFVKWIKLADFSEVTPSSDLLVSYQIKGKTILETISVNVETISYRK